MYCSDVKITVMVEKMRNMFPLLNCDKNSKRIEDLGDEAIRTGYLGSFDDDESRMGNLGPC